MGNRRARGAAGGGDDGHIAAAGVPGGLDDLAVFLAVQREVLARAACREQRAGAVGGQPFEAGRIADRKSTRLNSSHQIISYAFFCFKKKNTSPSSIHIRLSSHTLTLNP